MNEFFGNISSYEKILWIIAVPFSVLLIIQLFLNFFGIGDGEADMSADDISDSGADSYPIFTFRNFVIFFAIFSWSGIICIKAGLPLWGSLIISSVLAIIVIAIVTYIFVMISKLAESGNFNIKNCIGHKGNVYLEIPANRKGIGKIQLNIQSAFREIEAMTDAVEPIKTGALVKVEEVIDNNIVIVSKK